MCTGAVTSGTKVSFFKFITNDSPPGVDPFQWGYNGDKALGVVIRTDGVTDVCVNGVRKITYILDKSVDTGVEKPLTRDVEDALVWLANNYTPAQGKVPLDKTKILSPKTQGYIYNVQEGTATIISTCGDCVIGDVNNGVCVLQDKRWKQPYVTKGVIQPFNGGAVCPPDSQTKYKECVEDHDCKLSFDSTSDGCIIDQQTNEPEFILQYKIDEYNSKWFYVR